MNIIDILELKKPVLQKVKNKIYEQIQTNPDEILRTDTISCLAEKYNISQPTLTRFIKKLGYRNYFDFKQDVYITNKDDNEIRETVSLSRLESYAALIIKLNDFVSKEDYNKISQMLYSAKNVITIGMHKSYLPAKMMSYNLMKLSVPSFAFSTDNDFEVESFISKNDAVMIFSVTGDTHKNIMETLYQLDIPIILITQNKKAVSKKYAAKTIIVPSSKNQNMKYYLENQIVFSF